MNIVLPKKISVLLLLITFCIVQFFDSVDAAVQQIVLSAAKIKAYRAGAQVGSATGFFYSSNNQVFFVTNRHVVRPHDFPEPDKLVLSLNTSITNLKSYAPLEIPLYSHGKRIWKEHPVEHVDLVMIPLDKYQLNAFIIKSLSKKDVMTEEFPVYPAEGVFVMGYPLGFADEEHSLPIFRHAIIASSYGVPFERQRMCLIDGNLQQGMSGSPIFTQPTASRVNKEGQPAFAHDGMPFKLLGILSERIPAKFQIENNPVILTTPDDVEREKKAISLTIREEIGLANCWYPELLEEIADGNG